MSSPANSDSPTASPPPHCPAHAGHDVGGLVNLFSAEAVADPTATHEQLRAQHGPVAPVLVGGDVSAWLVLGYRENLEVAGNPARFTRDSRIWNLARAGKVPADSPLRPMTDWKPVIRFAEGEEHRKVRSALNDGLDSFNRRGIRKLVDRYSTQLINRFSSDGKADLVTQFSHYLPMLVLAELSGIPEHLGPRLAEASQDLVTGAPSAVASNDYIVQQLAHLVAEKRAMPGEDLASLLIGHSAELTDAEVVQNLRVTLVIAAETTSSLTASALRMLLTDPRFRASLAGGQMTLPEALDQILWDEPPFRTLVGRWATEDTEVGGQRIQAGDLMLLGLAAGNIDPAIRPDLDAPLHGNRAHLAFGGGAHECPGQDISRAIASTGIDTLMRRLPDLTLAVGEDELHWQTAWVARHLANMPVTFTPQPAIAAGWQATAKPRPIEQNGTNTSSPSGVSRTASTARTARTNSARTNSLQTMLQRLLR